MANDLAHTYFPYTHGDHIERDRELLKIQLKAEMRGLPLDQQAVSEVPSYYSSERSVVHRNSVFVTLQPSNIDKKMDLMAKFAHDEPLYLKKH